MRALGAVRQAAGLVVGAAVLALTALTYDGCDRFGASPYLYAAGAVTLAAITGAIAETQSQERLRAAAFAGVLVAVAGVFVLMLVFWGDDCTGA